MTEQRIEEKIDFFNLPVADEEYETGPNSSVTPKEHDRQLQREFGGIDPARPYAGYSVAYNVPVKDLDDYPAEASEYAQQELARRLEQGIRVMEEHITRNGLVGCSPVVYSRMDWENLGLTRYSIGVARDNADVGNANVDLNRFRGILDSQNLTALLSCTPGRNPITGGE